MEIAPEFQEEFAKLWNATFRDMDVGIRITEEMMQSMFKMDAMLKKCYKTLYEFEKDEHAETKAKLSAAIKVVEDDDKISVGTYSTHPSMPALESQDAKKIVYTPPSPLLSPFMRALYMNDTSAPLSPIQLFKEES